MFVPYGMVSAAQFYGITMRRHAPYGTKKEHWRIALACRAHASMNPHAQMFDRRMTMRTTRTSHDRRAAQLPTAA
jgi:acetyl-CoA acetyltransferase